MRVTEGTAEGARLRSPGGFVRSVSWQTRASIFEVLEGVSRGKVLDLYAGAGSLGIEALSRGAAAATFVEGLSIARLEANLETTRLRDRAEVLWTKVEALLSRPASMRYDVIFLDPPPNAPTSTCMRDLESLVIGGFLADRGSIVLCQNPKSSRFEPLGLRTVWERDCGERYVRIFTHSTEE